MLSSKKRRYLTEINVIPYVDVMLVLLVIFMVTAPFMIQGIDVDLPEVESQPIEKANLENVTISISSVGDFFIDFESSKNKAFSIVELKEELLKILNDEICETASRGMFVTMVIGIYDSQKKELLLSNAGHEHPLIYSKDGTFSNFEEAGPPLGIAPKFKFTEKKIIFKDSSMYIFTDGITEMKDANGTMLGQDGFQNFIKKYQDIPNSQRLKKIIEDLVKSDRIQKDDLTIVAIDGN